MFKLFLIISIIVGPLENDRNSHARDLGYKNIFEKSRERERTFVFFFHILWFQNFDNEHEWKMRVCAINLGILIEVSKSSLAQWCIDRVYKGSDERNDARFQSEKRSSALSMRCDHTSMKEMEEKGGKKRRERDAWVNNKLPSFHSANTEQQ